MESKPKMYLLEHPYAQEILTTLRDRKTDLATFRRGLKRLGILTGVEIAKTMSYSPVEVMTPLGVKAKGISFIDAHHIVMINVLRAATPFVDGILEVFREARLGVVSASRVEDKHLTPEYNFRIDMPYCRIPTITPQDTLIVADPMLASGSTAVAVLDLLLKKSRPKRIVYASVLATPLGLKRLHAHHTSVEICTASVDEGLNERGYIVPGLGDAGDRVCGTS